MRRTRKEAARKKAGLGERTPAGDTIKATPKGRQPNDDPNRAAEPPRGRIGPKARQPRAARARRRTLRDNQP
jgi:hypothetical protein